MGPGGGIRSGIGVPFYASCSLHGGSCGREGFCEAHVGLVEGSANVTDEDNNEIRFAPVLLDGRDEGGIISGVLARRVCHRIRCPGIVRSPR